MLFTKKQIGKRMLIYDEFFYTLYKETAEKTAWRCKQRSCTGKIILNISNETIRSIKHNHKANELTFARY